MTELIATEDLEIKFSNTVPGGVVYTGDIDLSDPAISATLDGLSKCDGKKIAVEEISYIFNTTNVCPFTFASHTFVSGAGLIKPSAIKTKARGKLVMCEKDEGLCIGSWINDSSGLSIVCKCDSEISNPGQTKVKTK